MSAWVAQHRKLLVSIAGAAATIAVQAGWTANPWVSLAILAATAAGVYRAPNEPQAAPAAPAPPDSPGGGGTRPVRVIPGRDAGAGQPGAAEPAAGTGGFPPSAFPPGRA